MNKSFTLIEILIVIVIIGILSSYILIGMNFVSESANITKNKAFSNSLRNSLLMNLVSEWKLDGNTNDSWGTNNGTWNGAGGGSNTTPNWRPESECVSGQCLHFDGTDDYIETSKVIFSEEFTVSFWANRNNTGANYDFVLGVDTMPGTGPLNKIGFSSSDNIFIRIFRGGNSTAYSTIGKNNWNFIVVSRDVNNKIDVSINSGNFIRIFNNNAQIGDFGINRIGIDEGGWPFKGLIDNIHIYNQVISNSQIQQNYFVGINKLYKNNGIALDEFNQRIGELKSNLANNE